MIAPRAATRCAIAFAVVAFAATPAVAAARDGRIAVAPGRAIYVECRGKGSPTVVLISGKGNGAADWHQVLDRKDPVRALGTDEVLAGNGDLHDSKHAVYPTIGRETRVCAYDRPNTRTTGNDTSTPRASPTPSTTT